MMKEATGLPRLQLHSESQGSIESSLLPLAEKIQIYPFRRKAAR